MSRSCGQADRTPEVSVMFSQRFNKARECRSGQEAKSKFASEATVARNTTIETESKAQLGARNWVCMDTRPSILVWRHSEGLVAPIMNPYTLGCVDRWAMWLSTIHFHVAANVACLQPCRFVESEMCAINVIIISSSGSNDTVSSVENNGKPKFAGITGLPRLVALKAKHFQSSRILYNPDTDEELVMDKPLKPVPATKRFDSSKTRKGTIAHQKKFEFRKEKKNGLYRVEVYQPVKNRLCRLDFF